MIPPGRQDETKTEEEKTKKEDSSTGKVPANEAQRTSPTSRSATARRGDSAIKKKIASSLDRLTKRRQDARMDKPTDYLFGDKTIDNITDRP